MSKFKIGDIVKCVGLRNAFQGKEGVVTMVYDGGKYYSVDWYGCGSTNGTSGKILESQLLLVRTYSSEPKPKFKIGDIVDSRIMRSMTRMKVREVETINGNTEYIVESYGRTSIYRFIESDLSLSEVNLRPDVTLQSKPVDPYAELKKAYKEGKTIQWNPNLHKRYGYWRYARTPLWNFPPDHYRVHPEEVETPVTPEVNPTQTKEENTMELKLETRHFLNGKDIADLSVAQIYHIVQQAEQDISELEKIFNQPKRLQKEIAERKADLKALVDFLDAQDGE